LSDRRWEEDSALELVEKVVQLLSVATPD